MGALLMLVSVVVAIAAIVAAVAGGYFHRPRLGRAVQIGVLVWGAAYATLLVATSVSSAERVLPAGEVKRFCGFYLDCHMGAAVRDIQRTASLGTPPNEVRPAGEFYVITIQVMSDARRATLHLDDPQAVIVDARGRVFQRSSLGERAIANSAGPGIPLDHPVPAGSQFTTPIVFDLPPDVRHPKLLLTDGPRAQRAIEQFLIGDEDSFLHKRTYHALTADPTIADGRR